jgi:hypothetical protein
VDWTEVTGWTKKLPFDPRREVIEVKFESDKQNPFNEVAHVTAFMIRAMIKLHNNSDSIEDEKKQGEIGKINNQFRIESGVLDEKTIMQLWAGEDECRVDYTFQEIAQEGRLPRHIEVDFLKDDILTGEEKYRLSIPPNKCIGWRMKWSSLVNSGSVKYINAAFNEYYAENIQLMGWKCFLKITTKWKGL